MVEIQVGQSKCGPIHDGVDVFSPGLVKAWTQDMPVCHVGSTRQPALLFSIKNIQKQNKNLPLHFFGVVLIESIVGIFLAVK